MKKTNIVKRSKFLSLVLRHQPQKIGLTLDESGWADVSELLTKMNDHGMALTLEELDIVVNDNDKQRFKYSDDRKKIRASQGHSLKVNLALASTQPPAILFHGTAKKNLDAIFRQGLLKRDRHHVHLTENTSTALKVGERYGDPILLKIDALAMYGDGFLFYCSDNHVWLTDTVPPQYIYIYEN
ncbi:RNA 2'-phosphotransferase [Pleionea litopenaei]|uniref:Probable RNA 2'-phosphotransferase n=1 Tax=Pleionea litopenaei TaxID=3070815 RepID=A0AA51RQT8_9GAMM|nr:RNA 2'-phosphotransferase [Pleionea sp. HL-JVS1]WMS85911.1 RNA 2'-phosphotransferase [Pleionea sp. HL-JVS1]